MKQIIHSVRMHSLKRMILWFGFGLVVLAILLVNNINFKSITSYCQVYNESDLNRCWKENPYVEVHTQKVYDGEYDYLDQKKEVAHFIDVDINGYSMISLIEFDLAQRLLEDESQNIVIKGKLEKFENGLLGQVYNKIRENYIKKFQEEVPKEEIMNNFTLVQLNQYQGSKISMYIEGMIGVILIALFGWLGIKEIKFVRAPEQYFLNKNIQLKDKNDVEKIVEELKNFRFHEKNIYITEHYLILKNSKIQVMEKKNVAWIFEKIVKQYGVTVGKIWQVYSLDQKKPFLLYLPGKKHKQLGEILIQEFPNATFGYQDSLKRKWNLEPVSFIKKKEE